MKSQKVTAFACIVCSSVHALEADAHTCCRCCECGGVFPALDRRRHSSGHGTCARCQYSVHIKAARERVERETRALHSAQTALDSLLAGGRPAPLPEARKRKFAPIDGERS